jgi:hypothetical protein
MLRLQIELAFTRDSESPLGLLLLLKVYQMLLHDLYPLHRRFKLHWSLSLPHLFVLKIFLCHLDSFLSYIKSASL